MAGWLIRNIHGIGCLVKEKVISVVSRRGEPQGLPMASRSVPSLDVGKHGWTHKNLLWKMLDSDWVEERKGTAPYPVVADSLPQVLLAAVADQREWSASRADDRGPIHEAALVRTTILGAADGCSEEVPVSLHEKGLVGAGLYGCGRCLFLESLRCGHSRTIPTINWEMGVYFCIPLQNPPGMESSSPSPSSLAVSQLSVLLFVGDRCLASAARLVQSFVRWLDGANKDGLCRKLGQVWGTPEKGARWLGSRRGYLLEALKKT